MREFLLIWRREVSVRLRDWRFWLGILSLPLFFLLVGVVYFLFHRSAIPLRIYYPSEMAQLSPLSTSLLQFVPLSGSPTSPNLLQEREALLIVHDTTDWDEYSLYTRASLGSEEEAALRQTLHLTAQKHRLRRLGLPESLRTYLTQAPSLRIFQISASGEAKPYFPEGFTSLGSALISLLYLLISTAGWQILVSTLEEKSNRLAEYLLTHISPLTLLTAKLLAILFLTLLEGLIWTGGALLAAQRIPSLQAFLPLLRDLPWVWIGLFLVGGVFLYAFLFAIGGASSDSVTELSGIARIVQWPLLITFILCLQGAQNPDSALLRFLSDFPLSAPVAMPLRLLSGEVPLLEKGVALLFLYATAGLVAVATARLYARALLLYGQRLSWKALWGLLRKE